MQCWKLHVQLHAAVTASSELGTITPEWRRIIGYLMCFIHLSGDIKGSGRTVTTIVVLHYSRGDTCNLWLSQESFHSVHRETSADVKLRGTSSQELTKLMTDLYTRVIVRHMSRLVML